MGTKLLNVGFGNVVVVERVVALVSPNSAPMRRLKDNAKDVGKLVDASQGRKTRSIIVTDSGHVILSAIQPETLAQRLAMEADWRSAAGLMLHDKKFEMNYTNLLKSKAWNKAYHERFAGTGGLAPVAPPGAGEND